MGEWMIVGAVFLLVGFVAWIFYLFMKAVCEWAEDVDSALEKYKRILDAAARRMNKHETDAGRPPIWEDV